MCGGVADGLPCSPPILDVVDSDTAGVEADTERVDVDTGSSGSDECHYDARLRVCWQEVVGTRPTWAEAAAPILEGGWCQPVIECGGDSSARFALVDWHGEYTDYQYWDADGAFVAAAYNTDTVESDDPCDCLRAGISSWDGYPVSDCWGGDNTLFALPGCPVRHVLTDGGELPESGLLTGSSSQVDSTVFQETVCAATGPCEADQTAVLRQTHQYEEAYTPNGGAIDVFGADGTLVGTADFGTGLSYGTVPTSCLAVTGVTAGCGL